VRTGARMSGRLGRHVIGRYGVGTLWCVREQDAFFVQFNSKKIARRSLKGGAWTAPEEGWKITTCEGGQILVQLNPTFPTGRKKRAISMQA
jgi:hypothetical protein